MKSIIQEDPEGPSVGVRSSRGDPVGKTNLSVLEALNRLSDRLDRIMNFLGITDTDVVNGASVREELVKLNKTAARVPPFMRAGMAKPSNTDLGPSKIEKRDELARFHAKVQNRAEGTVYEDVPVPFVGKNDDNVGAIDLDDEDFLNELVRNPGDEEYVKKLIGRHRGDNLQVLMNDLLKGIAVAYAEDKDSAKMVKEVLIMFLIT